MPYSSLNGGNTERSTLHINRIKYHECYTNVESNEKNFMCSIHGISPK